MNLILSGVMVWVFGGKGIANRGKCLIMGYWGYLLVGSIQQPTVLNIAVSIICLYYFGGMFANLFPTDKRVSWEGHVFGFISGIATSFIYPYLAQWMFH